VQTILQVEREKRQDSFQGHIQEQVQAQLQQLMSRQGNALVLHNPVGHRSSCASTTAIENDDNCYPIDDMEESKEYRLVTPVLGIPRTVAYGLATHFIEGTLFNSHSIPKGYAILHVDRVKHGHRRSKVEYSGENGESKLGKNVGRHVLWRKLNIEFGEEDSESSSSDSPRPQP
jgi:hypothetical protein